MIIKDFKNAAKLGGFLAKDYAKEFFELLVNYKDISASEAASRLGIHIQTAQDFLEAMTSLEVVEKQEVYERKRPYFRYALAQDNIKMEVDLRGFLQNQAKADLSKRIREQANSGANFSLGRGRDAIAHITLWTGKSRDRKEQKINLTQHQGVFLFHLPFPNSEPQTIQEIASKANIGQEVIPEILDIVNVLQKHQVVEIF